MDQLNTVDVSEMPLVNWTDMHESGTDPVTSLEMTTVDYTWTSSSGHPIDCYQYAKFDYDIPALIICGICLIVGIIYCFFGYRFFKATLFLTGFLFASVLIYLILDRLRYFSMTVNAGIAVSAGVIFGLVTMLVQCLALFVTGFVNGVFVAFILVTLWQSFILAPTIWAVIGVLIGVGLISASISLKWQRTMIIIGTSFVGGALLTAALDYVVDRFAIVLRVWEAIGGGEPKLVSWDTVCWYGWLVLCIWPCLFTLAALVQWHWTSIGCDHREGWRACCKGRSSIENELGDNRSSRYKIGSIRGGRQLSYVCKTSEEDVSGKSTGTKTATLARHRRGSSGDTTTRSISYESRPWRTIYQSRRAHGDVICQSYLESLHRLSSQTHLSPRWGSILDTPTFNSDHTRLTALTSPGSKQSLHCRELGKSPSVM